MFSYDDISNWFSIINLNLSYWDCTENGSDLLSVKPDGRSWPCGYAGKTMYAAFPHLHLGGETPLAERFVKACRSVTDTICLD